MDHRVSKDMISSGMTPSGEKTQADLGKTQYGSAPSPNTLMDAYYSMYQNQKEETLDEMIGKAKASKFKYGNEGITPRPAKRRKQTKSLDQVKADNEARKQKERDRSARARQQEADIADDIRADMEYQQEFDRIKNSPEAQKFEKDKFRAGQRKFKGNYGENVDLLAAYQSMYVDSFEEGKIPAGLQAYLDKKKGKKKDDDNGEEKKEGKKKAKKGKGGKPDFLDLDKDGDKKEPMKKASKEMKEGAGLYANIHAKRKRGGKMRKKGAKGAPSSQDFANAAKTAKEDVDVFDTILSHCINEGYDREDIINVMSSLTEEQLQMEDGGLTAMLGALATKAAAAKTATAAAKTAVGKKIAGGMGNVKKAFGKLSNIAKGKQTPPPPKTGGMPGTGPGYKQPKSPETFGSKVKKLATTDNMVKLSIAQGTLSGMAPQPKQTAGTLSASADLFDIVKGQLLDEGCTEEEIKEIMTTLTPEEIMNEMAVNPKIAAMDAKNKADMIARAKAKQVPQDVRDAAKRQYKAGTPREDPNNPYTTDDKKKIINQYKDK